MRQSQKAFMFVTTTLLLMSANASAEFKIQCHNKPKSGSGGLSEGGSGGVDYVKGMPEGGNQTRPESRPEATTKSTFADYQASLPQGKKGSKKSFHRLEKFLAKFPDAICKASDKGGVACSSAAGRGHTRNFKKLDPEILNKLFNDKITTASEAKGTSMDGYIASNMGYVSFSSPDPTAFVEANRQSQYSTASITISNVGDSADNSQMNGAR